MAVVLEVTKRKNLERSLNHLVGSLLNIRTTMKEEWELNRIIDGQNEHSELLSQSVELASQCIREVQVLCQGPHFQTYVKPPQNERRDVKNCARNGVSARALSPEGARHFAASGRW